MMGDFSRFYELCVPEALTGCWLWHGNLTDRPSGQLGYGRFYARGGAIYAHRLSYTIHKGEVPPGMYVCHRCDTPQCVNPDHLFLGNAKDNARDRNLKGRANTEPRFQGESSPMAKLDAQTVRRIRERYAAGETQLAMAREYGLSSSTVCNIVNRKKWRHVA